MKTIMFFSALLVAFWASAQNTWIGTTSSWTTTTNWSPTAPAGGPTGAVIINTIPAGKFAPVLSGNTTKTITDITFNHSGVGTAPTLNLLNPGTTLRVTGNFTNNTGGPDILLGAGRLVIYRTAAPTATITGSTEFRRLELDGTTATPLAQFAGTSQTYGVITSLKVTSGTLDVNGQSLILRSTCDAGTGTDRTAYIDGTGLGAISGNVTVTKCILPGIQGYKGLSCPIQSCNTSDLTDDVSSSFNPSYAYPTGTPADWIYFNEPDAQPGTGSDFYYGWKGFASGSIPAMQGLMVRYNYASGISLDWTGAVNNGTISRTLQYTPANSEPANDGFNLVGNPYPSPIDWQAYWDLYGTADLNPKVWVWNASGDYNDGQYFSYNADLQTGDLNDGSNIAIGQGFWVQSNTNNYSLTFENDIRTAGTEYTTLSKEPKKSETIRLSLKGKGNSDNLWMNFGEGTDFYTIKHDLGKMMNPGNSLYALKKDDSKVGIGGFPYPLEESIIPIEVQLKEAGEYSITASIFTIDSRYTAYLIDNAENIVTLLDGDAQYNFATSATNVSGRFSLKLVDNSDGASAMHVSDDIYTYQNNHSVVVNFTDKDLSYAEIAITDISGKTCLLTKTAIANGKATLDMGDLTSGIYIITAITNDNNYKQKISYYR